MHDMESGGHMMDQAGTGTRLAGGLVATTAVIAGRGLLGRLLRNPVVLLATGVAAGYLAHKYRKEIISTVAKATGAGKDFLLQQKESLADLIAEGEEAEEVATKKEVGQG